MMAGKLRNPVVIETATEARDAEGGVTRTWAKAAGGDVYASIEPLRGNETLSDNQVKASVTHRVTLRHHSSLTAESRIRFTRQGTTRYFHPVEPISPDERLESLVAMCTEQTSGAPS